MFENRNIHRYRGQVKSVVLDWAGTVVDCGVFAPTKAFRQVFDKEGVQITEEQARGPMGTHKRVHICKILEINSVRRDWAEKHCGREATDEDIDRMYDNFVPLLISSLQTHSRLIKGAAETIQMLQKKLQIKVGSSTGYTTPILDVLKVTAAQEGYVPDCYVAADEVPQARPCPHMVWLNAIRMDVHPIEAIIKVDDTIDGIKEGTSAGCWAVGIAETGNYMAASEDELASMKRDEYERRLQESYDILAGAGANFVVKTINDLPAVIHAINDRLARGLGPSSTNE